MGSFYTVNIQPPSKEIRIDKLVFRRDRFKFSSLKQQSLYELSEFKRIRTGVEEDLDMSISEGLAQLQKSYWTVIDNHYSNISDETLEILIHLFTGYWKYLCASINSEELKGSRNSTISERFIKNLRGAIKVSSNKKYQVALNRWYSSLKRKEKIDSVLDLCSSIEAFYGVGDELRLRISLLTFHYIKSNKRKSKNLIYKMYGLRNDFIHGKSFPKVENKDLLDFIYLVSTVLTQPVIDGKFPNIQKLSSEMIENYA